MMIAVQAYIQYSTTVYPTRSLERKLSFIVVMVIV